MAYLREIQNVKCYNCPETATVRLFSSRNIMYGFFCRSCGERDCAKLEEAIVRATEEAEEAQARAQA